MKMGDKYLEQKIGVKLLFKLGGKKTNQIAEMLKCMEKSLRQEHVFLNCVNGFLKEGTKLSLAADLDILQHQNLMKMPKR
jgi:hypothetical protein